MRKAILEYRLDQAEQKILSLEQEIQELRAVRDRIAHLFGGSGILNRMDIRISALEAAAGIVAIEKTEE
jgi:hypothetical protein